MLSTQTRLKIEEICDRIKTGQPVSLEDITYVQKWADHNRAAATLLNQARRVSAQGSPKQDSLDQLLNDLDLGDPDPSNHITGPVGPVDLSAWFSRDQREDWRQRD